MVKRFNKKRLKEVFTPFCQVEIPPKELMSRASNNFVKNIDEVWKNNLYLVYISYLDMEMGREGRLHVWIRLIKEAPVRSWQDFQKIKNELIGEEREALEIFPKASELVDDADWYHLWVLGKGELLRGNFPEFFMERWMP